MGVEQVETAPKSSSFEVIMNRHKPLSSLSLGFALLLALVCPAATPSPTSAGDAKPAAGAKAVTEIGVSHTPCYGHCPVYTFALKADGSVRYEGVLHVEHMGVRTGKVPKEKFDELAEFVLDSGFLKLKDDYSKPVTDLPSVITTVVAGGEKKSVRDYAHAGPKELAEVERKIDSLLAEVKWDEKVATTQPGGR